MQYTKEDLEISSSRTDELAYLPRCVAQNPRIELRELSAAMFVFSFFSATRTSHRDLTNCTLSFNCVQVHTLPTAQVMPALTDSFSWDYESYSHACKARPLTTVGWTSLSVIVIVIAACSLDLLIRDLVKEARGVGFLT